MQRRTHRASAGPERCRPPLLALATTIALLLSALLLLAACGSSSTTGSTTQTATPSVSPVGTDDSSPSPDALQTADPTGTPSPIVTTSPSPTGGMSSEQQLLSDYFTAVKPVYNKLLSQWWQAYHIADVRAHDTMDQTWPIAARLLQAPLAKLQDAKAMYRGVAPVPADLIIAHERLGVCIDSVLEYYSMARRGYKEGRDMDDDTAYGRTMTRLSKRSGTSYDKWKDPVIEQAQTLGVPIPWTWREGEGD
jgi:hypothetical protein